MIPSVLAHQLQSTVVDYLQTTFNLSNPELERRLFDFLRGPEGLLKGPYLDVRLPFRKAAEDEDIPLEIRPAFTPYTHQLVSFQRLSSAEDRNPQHTLVTTGTGSGKTECFLYPILDHCWRNRHQRGIKAILLYPMNALANDQARRLAQTLNEDPRLKGQVSAGLYVGGKGTHGATGADHLIDKRDVLRTSPPDILLTNYRMLDFLLLRPEDQPLWAHNGPDTLRYLVLDELHTYDGAQGSDVACLIRRLKERLEAGTDSLTCVGTSATIGAKSDPEATKELVAFASQVFGVEFAPDSVVEEDRYAAHEVLGMELEFDRVPRAEEAPELDPDRFASAEGWLEAQKRLWLGEAGLDPVALGERLKRHSFMRSLLAALDGQLSHHEDVAQALRRLEPDFEALPRDAQWPVLCSFLGLVSWARRPAPTEADPERTEPLFTCQVQLWIREVRRLVARLGPEPAFGWHGETQDEGAHHLPLVYCRDCGGSGFAAVQREGEDRLRSVLEEINRAWLERDRKARYVRLGVKPDGELPSYLCPLCLRYSLDRLCPKCGEEGLVAQVEAKLSEASPPRFLADCPDCGSEGTLGILGSRAASLLSVAISHVFLSPFNQDRKLLAFTDSVQDASHRAGYFGARTYRFNMRSALQAVVEAHGRVPLAEFADRMLDHWEERMPEPRLLASFLPPDLNDLPEHQAFKAREGKGSNRKLLDLLRKRLAWEAAAEYGLWADVGRSLERSGASVCEPEERALRAAAERLREDARERNLLARGDLPAEDVLHFLEGLLHRYQRRGGVYHPELKSYIANGGNSYLLTKRKNPLLPHMGRGTKRPMFLVDAPTGDLDSWIARGAKATWYRDWAARCFRVDRGDPGMNELYAQAVQRLTQAGLLQPAECKKATAWPLNPERMVVTRGAHHVRCAECGGRRQVSAEAAGRWAGRACLTFRCAGRYRDEGAVPESYYSRIYRSGEVRRVFAAEHTGLLERGDRERLEHRFKTGEGPGAPNLLVCTPTLEMGVDVGDLSAVLVCSVPPTTSNFLQRIGRAGRKTGNALCLTMANHEPHDLYFYASPQEMMAGQVLPPGCFLDAPEMLKRQVAAFAMDCWAKQETERKLIPPHVRFVLGVGQKKFPGRLLDYFEPRAGELTERFLALFQKDLSPEHAEELRAFPPLIPSLFQAAFEAVRRERDELKKLRTQLSRRLDEVEADPDCVADPEAEKQDLKHAMRVVERYRDQLGKKYPLNVLTDAGVLPNYAFPEPGVTLQALIADRQRGGPAGKDNAKPRYQAHEYIRPASAALKELAPFNTFYADGRKVEVSQIDVGSKAKPLVEKWRLCPHCTHADKAGAETEPPARCPRCDQEGWGDSGQVRDLVQFRRALSLTDLLESRTADDTDDRDAEFYDTADLIDAGPQNSRGAWSIERLPFGLELHERVTLRELNFGLPSSIGNRFHVAGRQHPEAGFDTCLQCGYVRDPRDPRAQEHAAWCSQRTSGKAERRAPVYLYREISSDAVRILLPLVTEGLEGDRASFKAAFQLGLRRKFRGNPGHLAVKALSEPLRDGGTARREFLVLYDGVPGGTGYLGDLGRPAGFREVLELALEAMRSCSCRLEPARDGCYRCVFAYQSQRELPSISRRRAVDLVSRILARWGEMQEVPSLSEVTLAYALESELETRFVRVLAAHFAASEGDSATETLHGGKRCWKITLKDGPVWLLEPQVDVGSSAGVDHASRPDFMLRPLAGAPAARPVAVFCDGLAYHVKPSEEQGGVADDLRKRRDLIDTGKHAVWSVTWRDLDDFEASGPAKGRPTLFAGLDRRKLEAMASGMKVQLPAAAHEGGSVALLVHYLRRPDPAQWRLLAQAMLVAALSKPFPEVNALVRLNQRLWDEPARFAPGPIGVETAPPPILGKVLDGRPWLLGVVRTEMAALQHRRYDQVRVTLRLFDEAPARRAPEFEEDWRTFLAGWNLLQFHEGTEVLTSEWLASEDLAEPLVAEPDAAPFSSAEVSDLVELADPSLEVLLRELGRSGLPLPEVGYEVTAGGRVVGELELAWPDLRLAVSAEGTPGWEVLPLTVSPGEVIQRLGGS